MENPKVGYSLFITVSNTPFPCRAISHGQNLKRLYLYTIGFKPNQGYFPITTIFMGLFSPCTMGMGWKTHQNDVKNELNLNGLSPFSPNFFQYTWIFSVEFSRIPMENPW